LKAIRIIAVGKIKKPFWAAAAEHYLKPLSRFARVERIVVKDAPAHLSRRNAPRRNRSPSAKGSPLRTG
jgi:23S rRNA (pseudouridine1915-N3)-methyltransferase